MTTDTTPDTGAPHLWEIKHPYYGADGGRENECEDFAELRAIVDDLDADMNHVYRWDWDDWSQPHYDDLFLYGERRDKQQLRVYIVMPRKSMCISFACPITHEQEPEVLAWLQSARVLGSLRAVWEPILDGAAVSS